MKFSNQRTFKFGCLIERNQAIFVQTRDALRDTDRVFTDIGSYSPNLRPHDPWRVSRYEGQQLRTCCIWKNKFNEIMRCALSEEGMVNIYGPGGNPDASYQIPDAGVWREGAAGYGYVHRIRAVGETLYVCGTGRQVYRFVFPTDVQDSADLLKRGHFEHSDAGLLMPPAAPYPGDEDEEVLDQWLDAMNICQFTDIAGTDEADIYVTGDETWHFDGQSWKKMHLKVTDETMHVIKAVNKDRILIGGANGYLFMGNARDGFSDISGIDDNFTITGLEIFNNTLFVATDHGIYTVAETGPDTHELRKYRTNLKPDLQDAHVLEAKDGVLWSFGYKDLAYWDSSGGNTQWTRVDHPENPPIGSKAATKASRQPPAEAPDGEVIQARATALTWLPPVPRQPGQLDIGGLLARVGHQGVGEFIVSQLQRFGLKPAQVLQTQSSKRYTVAVPKQGIDLHLQYVGPKDVAMHPEAKPEHWALAEVDLKTQHADAGNYWRGPWFAGLDPIKSDLLERARAEFGQEAAAADSQVTFFVEGPHGADWVVNIEWGKMRADVRQLRVLHLGGYLPWPA